MHQKAVMALTKQIKRKAREIGFDFAGIAKAGPAQSHAHYVNWLAHGYHGEMNYLARPDAIARRADVRELLPTARSIVVVGMNYYFLPLSKTEDGPRMGTVARYAWGEDYHKVMADRLKQLVTFIEAETGHLVAHKICVDTSAVLEREWGVRAGLGWIGKNTMLIHPHAGSWFLLGELLLDLDLECDAPFAADHCGTCARCVEACPTQCILSGRALDASRCISYLTIELRGNLPVELHDLVGDWVFGCDVCQQVCPWNRFARPTSEPAFAPRHTTLDLRELARMDEETFQARFARSAIRRARLQGLVRNAALVAAHQAR